jgi:predicted component of type VI protein secretion system
MTWLEYKDSLQELPLDSELIVGTGAQATWRIRHADLMPRHFIVSRHEDGAKVRPFSSEAVVSLDGRQLTSGATTLGDGDVISAGAAQFRFWATSPREDRMPLLSLPITGHLIDTDRRSAVSLHRVSTGIGKDDSNTIVLDAMDVTGFHAEIRREAGGHALRASASARVLVNGKAVSSPVLLSEGDEIEIGDRLLRYTREPLAVGVYASEAQQVTESLELSPVEMDQPRYAPVATLTNTVALRTPMRAVALVSSLIAAVAIATLVLMHRGP